jgi:hypothetical protein
MAPLVGPDVSAPVGVAAIRCHHDRMQQTRVGRNILSEANGTPRRLLRRPLQPNRLGQLFRAVHGGKSAPSPLRLYSFREEKGWLPGQGSNLRHPD